MQGRTANGEPGVTPLPWLASRTRAAASCTGTQMLMPSVPPTSTPRCASASTTPAPRALRVPRRRLCVAVAGATAETDSRMTTAPAPLLATLPRRRPRRRAPAERTTVVPLEGDLEARPPRARGRPRRAALPRHHARARPARRDVPRRRGGPAPARPSQPGGGVRRPARPLAPRGAALPNPQDRAFRPRLRTPPGVVAPPAVQGLDRGPAGAAGGCPGGIGRARPSVPVHVRVLLRGGPPRAPSRSPTTRGRHENAHDGHWSATGDTLPSHAS